MSVYVILLCDNELLKRHKRHLNGAAGGEAVQVTAGARSGAEISLLDASGLALSLPANPNRSRRSSSDSMLAPT